MDIGVIKEIASLPALFVGLAVCVYIIIRLQMQIEKLVDSIIRINESVARNVLLLSTNNRAAAAGIPNTGEASPPS